MARYGALTALQAALLGISGGAQGLVQAREREQKEAERRKQFEREELRDQREIARDEAERTIRLHVAPELQAQPFSEPDRRPGESDRSYARRKKTIDALFGR